jgi:hypothetical protein
MRTYEVTMRVTRYEKVLVEVDSREQMEAEARAKTVLGDMERAEVFHYEDKTPKARSVKERIKTAFKHLRKVGVVARMNYTCCQSCGWAQLESDYPDMKDDDTVVFYHSQDNEAFDKKGNLLVTSYWDGGELKEHTHKLCLRWNGDGALIRGALQSQGLLVEWNESPNQAIQVVGVREGSL